MSIIDLHIHSKYSDDAELSVREILAEARRRGVKTLAFTDHNSVRANGEAIALGREYGVNVIAGIELDCACQGVNLHLLGYHIDWQDARYAQLERRLHDEGMAAFPVMLDKLRALGIEITSEEVLAVANGQIPCGEHVAEVLLHRTDAAECELLRPYLPGGSRSDMPYVNFYWDYFSQGKAAYVPANYMDLRDAVQLVRSSGGLPVIAHPGANLKDKPEFIDEIIKCGIAGIEVYNNYHTPEQVEFYRGKALQSGLLITCGSDFHGKNKPRIAVGQCDNEMETQIATNILAGVKKRTG